MTNENSVESLRLADELDAYHTRPHHRLAAVELRRQFDEIKRLHEENQAMLEALKGVLKIERGTSGRIIIEGWQEDAILAAIAKAEGMNKGEQQT